MGVAQGNSNSKGSLNPRVYLGGSPAPESTEELWVSRTLCDLSFGISAAQPAWSFAQSNGKINIYLIELLLVYVSICSPEGQNKPLMSYFLFHI